MKKYLILAILFFVLSFSFQTFSFAKEVVENNVTSVDNTVTQSDNRYISREEAKGKTIWEKLQAKELKCGDLTDDNFGTLGEYYMGQIIGNSHEEMNNVMTQMLSVDGEKQIHVEMGKRLSGCDTSAVIPASGTGFMSIMQTMMGGGIMGSWSNPFALNNNSNNPMINFGSTPFGWTGGIFMILFMILFWTLVIVGIVALIKWLVNQNRDESKSTQTVLNILKERYIKGEIDKKEFEEKKKDLS